MKIVSNKIILVLLLALLFCMIPYLGTAAFAVDEVAQDGGISADVSIDTEKGKIQEGQYVANHDGTISEVGKSNKKTNVKSHLKKLGQGIAERAIGQELVDKRDAFSKHYLNSDGTVTAYISGAPIHYNDGTGFKDIDLSITSEVSGQYEYSCTQNTFEAYFNNAASIDEGKLARFVLKNSQGTTRAIEYSLPDAKPTGEVAEDNTFRYSNIYDNVDLEYILDSDKLKENIIIKTPVPSFQYRFRLNIDGANITRRVDGGIDFTDVDTGEKLWEIAPPVAEDSSDNVKKTTNVSYDLNTVSENDTTYTEITVSLNDTDFLNSAVYPIIIDPTTSLTRSYGRHIGPSGFAQSDTVYGYAYSGFPYGNLTEEFRVFLNFNISSIPSNAVINSSTLTIIPAGYLGTGVYSGTFLVKRLLSDATNATWSNQPSTSTSNQVSISTSYLSTKVWDITAMMQEIWTNSYTFYGFSLTAYPPHNYVFWYDYTNYPTLSVTYTPNTAPTVTPLSPANNTVYSESDTSAAPSIRVYDAENNTLTCKFYVDSESTPRDTKSATGTSSSPTVTFAAFNPSTLSEGTHTLKYTANDGMATTTQTTSIKVDKTAPTITTFNTSSTENSISITAQATDSIAGLDPSPYRYTVGTMVGSWGSNTSYTQSSLTPDTTYTVELEARDLKGHIASSTRNVTTNAQAPTLTISDPAAFSLKLTATDGNPSTTLYQFICGSNYVSSTGTLTSTPSWITLTGKSITVTGLTQNTTYTFQVKAKSSTGIETALSSLMSLKGRIIIDFKIIKMENSYIPVYWIYNPIFLYACRHV